MSDDLMYMFQHKSINQVILSIKEAITLQLAQPTSLIF